MHKPPSIPSLAPRAVVFIVDDDQSIRSSLTRLLSACGYETKAFVSGLSFLAFRTASHPDATHPAPLHAPECLVLDICMPGMDGLTLQQELVRRGDKIPLIFITAHGDQRITEQAMEAGAVALLSKPFDLQDLQNAIEVALVKRRS